MNKRTWIRVSAAVVLLAGLLAGWFYYRGREVRRIRRDLKELSRLVSKPSGAGPLVLAVQAGRASEYFTEDCRIDFGDPVPRIIGREVLAGQILLVQGLVEQVNVEAVDVTVEIDPSRDRAASRLTVLLTFREPGVVQPEREAREVELDWVKRAGRWRIETLRMSEILR